MSRGPHALDAEWPGPARVASTNVIMTEENLAASTRFISRFNTAWMLAYTQTDRRPRKHCSNVEAKVRRGRLQVELITKINTIIRVHHVVNTHLAS